MTFLNIMTSFWMYIMTYPAVVFMTQLLFIFCILYFYLQEEIEEMVGEEALELGLLFGIEIPQEEEMDALCFLHHMLQEFAAGVFISRQEKVCVSVFYDNKNMKIGKISSFGHHKQKCGSGG